MVLPRSRKADRCFSYYYLFILLAGALVGMQWEKVPKGATKVAMLCRPFCRHQPTNRGVRAFRWLTPIYAILELLTELTGFLVQRLPNLAIPTQFAPGYPPLTASASSIVILPAEAMHLTIDIWLSTAQPA
jgi:hypothetical protein